MTGEIGVLVAEDQRLLRASLIALFNAEPDMTVLGEAADGERAVAEASRLRPDVVLMDIRMPALSGIEATARICADPRLAHTRILILSLYELDEYVLGPYVPAPPASSSRTPTRACSSTPCAPCTPGSRYLPQA